MAKHLKRYFLLNSDITVLTTTFRPTNTHMSLTAHIPAATLWIQGLGVLVPGVYGIFRPQTVIDSIGDFAFGGNPDKLVVSMRCALNTEVNH